VTPSIAHIFFFFTYTPTTVDPAKPRRQLTAFGREQLTALGRVHPPNRFLPSCRDAPPALPNPIPVSLRLYHIKTSTPLLHQHSPHSRAFFLDAIEETDCRDPALSIYPKKFCLLPSCIAYNFVMNVPHRFSSAWKISRSAPFSVYILPRVLLASSTRSSSLFPTPISFSPFSASPHPCYCYCCCSTVGIHTYCPAWMLT
jgi:hypothetical protein